MLLKEKKRAQHGCIISLTTSQRAKVPFKTLQINKKEETQKVGEGRDRKGGVYQSDGIKRDLTRSY